MPEQAVLYTIYFQVTGNGSESINISIEPVKPNAVDTDTAIDTEKKE